MNYIIIDMCVTEERVNSRILGHKTYNSKLEAIEALLTLLDYKVHELMERREVLLKEKTRRIK